MKYAKVIVVIVICLACGGLLVPAISKVREAAARTRCIDNLKQIVISLNSFQNSLERFPAATASNIWNRDPSVQALPVEQRFSWIYEISPYVESRMDPKWRVDYAMPWDAEENRYVAASEEPLYLCPANPASTETYPPTHYLGIAGLGKDAIHLPRTDPAAGMFGFDRGVTLAEIKDGTTTTMAVAETARDNGPWAKPGYATVRGLDQETADYLGASGQFSSYHYEGTFSRLYRTYVAMADASVKSLSEKLSPRIFEALSTIAGGEKIDPLAFQ